MEVNDKNKSRVGDIIEYRAIIWLTEQGFEVFKNAIRVGPVDLVILDRTTGVIKLVDVKKVVDKNRPYVRISNPTLTQQQKGLNVHLLFYNAKLDLFAWSINEVYQQFDKQKQELQATKCMVADRQFDSLASVARFYGVKVGTLREWMRTHPEKTLEEAINNARDNSKLVVIDGVEYTDKKHACTILGISMRKIEYWHYEKGLTVAEAFDYVINHTKERKPRSATILK